MRVTSMVPGTFTCVSWIKADRGTEVGVGATGFALSVRKWTQKVGCDLLQPHSHYVLEFRSKPRSVCC